MVKRWSSGVTIAADRDLPGLVRRGNASGCLTASGDTSATITKVSLGLLSRRSLRRRGQRARTVPAVKWVRRLVLAAGLLLAVSGAVLAFALQPGQPVNWTALGLIILIVGLAVLSGAVVSPRNAPNDPALRTDRLIGLVQTSGGALTVALAMTFTVVVALVAIPLAAGPDRATVAQLRSRALARSLAPTSGSG